MTTQGAGSHFQSYLLHHNVTRFNVSTFHLKEFEIKGVHDY